MIEIAPVQAVCEFASEFSLCPIEGPLDFDRSAPDAESHADRMLIEAIGRALCSTGFPALREVMIEIHQGIIVLGGRVRTYYQKQVAQSIVRQVEGIRGVSNRIEVLCCR